MIYYNNNYGIIYIGMKLNEIINIILNKIFYIYILK